MNIDFQEDILKFLAQLKDSRKYLEVLDASLFDAAEHQVVLELIQDYVGKYKHLPTRGSLIQYWDKAAAKMKQALSKEQNKVVEDAIREAFEPLTGGVESIKAELIEHAQYKRAKKMLKEYTPKMKEGPEAFKLMFKEMRNIVELDDKKLGEVDKPVLAVLADHEYDHYDQIDGAPTFLKALNRMTAAGGFYTPQLIIFMKGPKQFGTGLLIAMLTAYMRDGKKIAYADFENGEKIIRRRIKQSMAECTMAELKKREIKDILSQQVKRYQAMGGDAYVKKFQANKDKVSNVKIWLDELREDKNFEPEIIIWDYPDIIAPEDEKLREERHKINAVYHEIINLHDEFGCFGFGISPVNRNALGKPVFDVKDLGEDVKKSFNAHAIFALCCTENEEKAGIRRIVPVVQREGVGRGRATCVIELDEAKGQVRECSFEHANEILEALEKETGQKDKPKRAPKPDKKSLKDE